MDKGKIIRIYRRKGRLTQEQLCEGICSVTHLSKIELDQTHAASETLLLLSKRLNINIEDELSNMKSIIQKLDDWLQAMIMENQTDIERIKTELNQNELIKVSGYHTHFELLLTRYYLSVGDKKKANIIITNIQEKNDNLSPYEKCLFKHVLGIIHIQKEEYLTAINILKSINDEVYKNLEYYFDLSFAYDRNDSFYLSIYYARTALQYFSDTNNYLRMIDTELLILILQSRDKLHKAENRIEKYKKIMSFCEVGNHTSRKAKILNNLGQEYFELEKYNKASEMYKLSLHYKQKKSSEYLMSLEGYIICCLKGNILPPQELLTLTHNGIDVARQLSDHLNIHLLMLVTFLIKHEKKKYFDYLEEIALPYLEEHGHITLDKKYKKELFNYLLHSRQHMKANKLANSIINN